MTFWTKGRHSDRRPLLAARNALKTAVRRWFEAQGYSEVEPAILQVSPGNETHVHAFSTLWRDEAGLERRLYLHTSPEFAMKKLLAAGEEKIFAFSPSFRNREQASALHAPEFTMLEWYEVGASVEKLMDQCGALLALTTDTVGARRWTFRGRSVDATCAPERVRVADAFAKAGVDVLATISARGATHREGLAAKAQAIGIQVSDSDDWSDIFSKILVERIEGGLGEGRATILYEYPIAQAALARACAHDPRLGERFEIYACGVELANGFGELTDPDEQRRRFQKEMAEKERRYGEAYPIDEDFLAALAQMPASSGCALGFDRLVMLATGAPRLEDVMWTPLS